MPSKKTLFRKIRELENELMKLKAWAFEHYCIDSQENTKVNPKAITEPLNSGAQNLVLSANDTKTLDTYPKIKKDIDEDYELSLYENGWTPDNLIKKKGKEE